MGIKRIGKHLLEHRWRVRRIFPRQVLAAIERTIKKLGKRYDRLHVCFEAGPTGYGLYRQVRELNADTHEPGWRLGSSAGFRVYEGVDYQRVHRMLT